jgi:hypothetical protein
LIKDSDSEEENFVNKKNLKPKEKYASKVEKRNNSISKVSPLTATNKSNSSYNASRSLGKYTKNSATYKYTNPGFQEKPHHTAYTYSTLKKVKSNEVNKSKSI